jgi:hypothetical protein
VTHPIKNLWHKHRLGGESLRRFARRVVRGEGPALDDGARGVVVQWAQQKRLDIVSHPGARR